MCLGYLCLLGVLLWLALCTSCPFCFRESSNKENNSHPEWSFTTVRKKPDAKKLQNGTVCTEGVLLSDCWSWRQFKEDSDFHKNWLDFLQFRSWCMLMIFPVPCQPQCKIYFRCAVHQYPFIEMGILKSLTVRKNCFSDVEYHSLRCVIRCLFQHIFVDVLCLCGFCNVF